MAAVRMFRTSRLIAVCLATLASVVAFTALPLFSADLRPDYRPAAYAIKGAKIVVSPETTIDVGTVVIRQGMIERVGKVEEVDIPFDAETIDGKGLVVHAGFIDLYTTLGQAAGTTRSRTGPGRNVPYADFALPHTPTDNRNGLTPEFVLADSLELPDNVVEERRKMGFTDLLAAPGGSIATGQSALVSLSGLPRREVIVQSPVALHITLQPPSEPPPPPRPDDPPVVTRRRTGGTGALNYPVSLMGVVAHLRQAMLDAEHDQELRSYYAAAKSAPLLPFDPALQALYAARTGKLPVWWEANTRDETIRALDLTEEFGTHSVIVGGRDARKVADRLKAHGVPIVLRLNFPDEPKVPTEAEYRKRPIEERIEPLRVLADNAARWKDQVATAKTLAAAGVKFAFSTDGLTKAETFPAQLRKVIAAGLSREAALAALTRDAAAIAGLDNRLGTIEPGKLGHLVVLSGALGSESSRVRYVFVDGLKFDLSQRTTQGKTKKGESGDDSTTKRESAEGKEPSKTETRAKKDEPGNPTQPKAETAQTKSGARRIEPAEPQNNGGQVAEAGQGRADDEPKNEAAPSQDDPKTEGTQQPKAEPKKETAQTKSEPKAETKSEPKAETKSEPKAETKSEPKAESKAENAQPTQPAPTTQPPAPAAEPAFVDVATELDNDRKPRLHTGGNVLIRDATILTVSSKGTIPQGSILVKGGKIAAVGTQIDAPEGVLEIDAKGLVAMPGIIDTHSHMAIAGNLNELSLSIVPEVRVKDVVTGTDPAIYRALAGGTTAARLLHGSSDTIGGQDAVIKLRVGQPGRDLILRDGPQGVKFALGENVTRRNGRFPTTRMGVEAAIERSFEEARAYRSDWDLYTAAKAKGQAGPPPRRDLRLEALAGVLDGSIKIHSHCYRSDEILMLLRLAARHGVRVQSLQHVLEGYKVAAEIAASGASASTFSDWWAYKIEAYDAIPFNSALLAQAGAQVCIKSDDEELVRHLYLEAAKMVKYGGVSETQALEMITLNPARQIGLDHRMGSIEVGKDADIALFNAHPFDGFARCELSLIDGEVWFQRREPDGKFAPRPGSHTSMPVASVEARARNVGIPTNPKGAYAIIGATLHPITGPAIENGTLVVAAGKIAALGGPETPVPADAQSIDAQGLDVWPGMIDAGNILGLFEVGSLAETQDFSDSAQFQPELRASSAIHPDSELIPVTRANGVLTSYVQPSGGTISGQGCVLDLSGWVPSEMVLLDCAALNVSIPRQLPGNLDGARDRFPGNRQGRAGTDPAQQRRNRLEAIKEQFRLALEYDKVMSESAAHKVKPPTPDPRMAALLPYAKGEKPVFFRAEKVGEIVDALKIAAELKLKAVITGGVEAWKVANELKAAKVPVLINGTLQLPSGSTDPYDAPYANPARLHEAGVTFAIRSGGRAPDLATAARNLPYEAAVAVAYGLPEAEALKAVTLTPAQILGVADRLGSLEQGKRANLVITAGHILQPTTIVKALFIGGKPLTPESRHTRLYAKYSQRLADVTAGIAPLGIEVKPLTAAAPAGGTSAPASPSSSDGRR
jgi:imidazolonepropionase-like amidohydrolase